MARFSETNEILFDLFNGREGCCIASRRPSESKIATPRLAANRARGKLNPGKQRSKIVVGVDDNAGMFLDDVLMTAPTSSSLHLFEREIVIRIIEGFRSTALFVKLR